MDKRGVPNACRSGSTSATTASLKTRSWWRGVRRDVLHAECDEADTCRSKKAGAY